MHHPRCIKQGCSTHHGLEFLKDRAKLANCCRRVLKAYEGRERRRAHSIAQLFRRIRVGLRRGKSLKEIQRDRFTRAPNASRLHKDSKVQRRVNARPASRSSTAVEPVASVIYAAMARSLVTVFNEKALAALGGSSEHRLLAPDAVGQSPDVVAAFSRAVDGAKSSDGQSIATARLRRRHQRLTSSPSETLLRCADEICRDRARRDCRRSRGSGIHHIPTALSAISARSLE